MSKLNLFLICFIIFSIKININFCLIEEKESERIEILREILKKLTNSLDKDVNPCSSIVQHVCGKDELFDKDKLIRENLLKDDYMKIKISNDLNILSKSEIQLKKFLESCKKTDNYKEQFKELSVAKSMGGWPFFTSNWTGNEFDWIRSVAEMNRARIRAIFQPRYKVSIDSESNLLVLNPSRDNPLTIEYITNPLQEIGIRSENLNEIAKEIIQFTNGLIELIPQITIKEEITKLQKEIPEFDFKKYIEIFLERPIESESNLRIQLPPSETFKKIVNYINAADKRVVANFLMWKTANEISWTVDSCYISSILDPILSKIFVQQMFSETDQKLALDVYKEIQVMLRDSKGVSVSDDDYDYVQSQINDYVNYLNNYTILLDNERLDSFYQKLILTTDNYLQNQLNIFQEHTRYTTDAYDKNIDEQKKMNRFKEVSAYFKKIQKLHGYPAEAYFAYLAYEFWLLDVLEMVQPSIQNKITAITSCLKDLFKPKDVTDSEALKNQIFYNNAFRLTHQSFENWLQDNLKQHEKYNEILAEYGLNNMKLLSLMLIQNYCASSKDLYEKMANNEIIATEFGCEIKPHVKCEIKTNKN